MGDTVYRVKTVYDVETGAADASVKHLGEHFSTLAMGINQARELIGSFYSALKSGIGDIIHIGAAMEANRIAMAGMIQAGGFGGIRGDAEGFEDAMRASEAMMHKIHADAKGLPGTAEQLRSIFQQAIPASMTTGMSLGQTEQMAAKAMAVGNAFGMQADTIGHSLAMMLQGHARSIDPLFRNLAGYMKGGQEGFNKMTAPERARALLDAFAKFQPMIDKYGESWNAVATTVEMYGEEVEKAFSKPVTNVFKSVLVDISKWYEKHEEEVQQLARDIGETLAGAIGKAWDAAKGLGGALASVNWGSVATLATMAGGAILFCVGAMNAGKIGAALFAVESKLLAEAQLFLTGAFSATGLAIMGVVTAVVLAIGYIDELRESMESMFEGNETMFWMLKKAGVVPENVTFEQYKAGMDESRDREYGIKGKFGARQEAGRNDLMSRLQDNLGINLGLKVSGDKSKEDPTVKKILEGKGISVKPTTNIGSVNIHQTVNAAEDPDRVFIDMKRAIEAGIHHPTESPTSLGAVIRS